MMKPMPFKSAQVIIIRLSQALASSTVLPDFEKFTINSAIDAVTTAAIVEISRIWLQTSFVISSAFFQTVVAAKAFCVKQASIHTIRTV